MAALPVTLRSVHVQLSLSAETTVISLHNDLSMFIQPDILAPPSIHASVTARKGNLPSHRSHLPCNISLGWLLFQYARMRVDAQPSRLLLFLSSSSR